MDFGRNCGGKRAPSTVGSLIASCARRRTRCEGWMAKSRFEAGTASSVRPWLSHPAHQDAWNHHGMRTGRERLAGAGAGLGIIRSGATDCEGARERHCYRLWHLPPCGALLLVFGAC